MFTRLLIRKDRFYGWIPMVSLRHFTHHTQATASSTMVTPHTPQSSSQTHSDTSPCTSSVNAHSQGGVSPSQGMMGLFCKRKRKPTYYARKDELEALCKESETLIHQLGKLKKHRQCPLTKILSVNASLRLMIKRNRQTIATAQSFMDARSLQCGSGKPLVGSFIRLPVDKAERQRVLREMKPQKLEDALEYLLTRSQHLDLRSRARQSENYVTAEGDHVSILWDVSTFDGEAASAEQVFNVMLEFVRQEGREKPSANRAQEIVNRRANGNSEAVDATQARFMTCDPPTEKNLVLHATFSTSCERLNQPHGVLSIDSVDHDGLYPYQSGTHIRNDLTMAALVVECPRRRGGERRTISFIRWAQMKTHASPLASFDALEELSRDGLRTYFDSMASDIRERIESQ